MTLRRVAITLIALIMTTILGCPSTGPVGAWVFRTDVNCDISNIDAFMVVLHPGQQAELFRLERHSGTWNVVNGILAVQFPDVSGSQWIYTAHLGSGVISDGALSIDGAPSGCVSGQTISP